MALNKDYQTTFTSGVLVTDTEISPNGSSDSIPDFTKVGGEVVSAALEVQSSVGGVLVPRMTSAEEGDMVLTDGIILYNNTTGTFRFRQSGGWSQISASSGTVTSVATGTGLTGGPITASGTINMANTAVTPGSYTTANITVDAQGRLTAASTGSAGTVTSVGSGTGLTGGPITGAGSLALANTAVTPGSYTTTNLTVDAQGRITAASSGAGGASDLDAVLTAGNDATNQSIIGLTAISFGTAATPEPIEIGVHGALAAGADATSVAIGSGAIAGVDGVSIGRTAGTNFTGSINNIAIGIGSLNSISSSGADDNIAIGLNAGTTITQGSANVLIGKNSADSLTTGNENVILGNGVFTAASVADNNVVIGSGLAGWTITGGGNNVCIGTDADAAASDENCIAIGTSAKSGGNGISIGRDAGINTALLADENIAIGHNSLNSLSNFAFGNTAVGKDSGTAVTTGGSNCCFGNNAGNAITSGSSNTAMGDNTDCSATASNQTAIGNGTVTTAANQVYLGNSSVSSIKGQVGFTTYSDARFKENVENLPLGLNLINALTPKTYTINTLGVQEMRADRPGKLESIKSRYQIKREKINLDEKMSDKKKTKELSSLEKEEVKHIKDHNESYDESKYADSKSKVWCGLIAQEVEETIASMSPENLGIIDVPHDLDREVYGMRYTQLIPVLINAVKELSAKVDALEGARA